jgi:hypothetical protein
MRRAWLFALLLIASLTTGCKQGEGDRCQLDSDCEDGLLCCIDPARLNEGGVCRPEGKCDLTRRDGGTDGAVDVGPDDDGTPDKSVADQAPKADEGPNPDKGSDTQPVPDTTPTPDVTPAQDQKSVPDTFTVDQSAAQDQ